MNRPWFRYTRRVSALLGLLLTVSRAHAVSCPVIPSAPPSDADIALLSAHFSDAENLYRAALATHPADPHLATGLVHALLRQQKVQEAADAVQTALAAAPQNAALVALRGEVELRQGVPWDAVKSAQEAEKLDICNPRAKMLLAEYARISSLYATAQRLIRTAHQLDPADPEIREEWLMTLPPNERIAELEDYLKQPTGADEEEVRHLQMTLEHWKKIRDNAQKPCRLASDVTSTEVPMAMLMRDALHIRAFGLEVKINDRAARLEIDTGAGGLLVTSAVARRAGLVAFSQNEVGGVGDKGYQRAYTAYADSIRIGGLEFHNCAVEVLDSKRALEDSDGLIGMDVLSHFLVTLDYPMRKIVLGPLPPRPGESPAIKPELKTGEGSAGDEDEDADSAQGAGKTAGEGDHDKAHQATTTPSATHGPFDRYVAPEMTNWTSIYRVGHDLIIPASLNASKIRLFILDTGSWSTVISPQAAREVTKVHTDGSGMTVRGISGKVETLYTADDVTFRFANLSQKVSRVASFDTSNISKNVGLEISGFLGATTLELVTMHIDYRDGLVKFDYDPNRGYRY